MNGEHEDIILSHFWMLVYLNNNNVNFALWVDSEKTNQLQLTWDPSSHLWHIVQYDRIYIYGVVREIDSDPKWQVLKHNLQR